MIVEPRVLAERMTSCFEEVAREYAAEIGFDLQTERHGLFRMLMTVMASEQLRKRAIALYKERYE